MGPLEMAENKSVTWVIYPPYVELNKYKIIYNYTYIHIYTWNPKDPCFDWKGLLLGELTKTKIEIIWALHFPTGDFLPTFYGTCHDLPRPMPAQKLPNWLHWPISKRRLTQATASCRWLNGLPGICHDLLPYLARRHPTPKQQRNRDQSSTSWKYDGIVFDTPVYFLHDKFKSNQKFRLDFFACAD